MIMHNQKIRYIGKKDSQQSKRLHIVILLVTSTIQDWLWAPEGIAYK